MLAEIITIGDELLIGQVIDTNSAFIAKALNKIGVSVYQITSIQDDRAHILKALKDAESNVDIIIITGGLGPTKDDITKNTITEYFDDTLVQDISVLENIKALWQQYARQNLLQVNLDQALVPSKATILMNVLGTAPGMWIEKDNKVFISLPGVPYEMEALMANEVVPKIRHRYRCPFILHKTLLIFGLGESSLAERIEEWENRLPKHIKLAYLPEEGRMRLRLSAKGFDEIKTKEEVQQQIDTLLPLIEDEFFGFEEEDDSTEKIIATLLTKLKKTVATAESFTGGKIAERITKNPGAAAYFKGSVVTYATHSKIEILGVPKSVIDAYSVVSAPVAEAMAARVLQLFNTDYAVATTGNAGPSKGDSDAEVGTGFIAIATKEKVYSAKFILGKQRMKVIDNGANKAFEMLLKEILKN